MKLLLITLIPLCAAILGALGGSRNSSKLFRRLGIPLLVAIAAVSLGKHTFLYTSIGLFVVLAWCGYGDESWIRRIAKSDSATRFIYGALFGAAFWPGITSLQAGILSIVATACVFDLFGVLLKNEPVIEIGDKQLLVEDMIVYGVGTLFGVSLMIG